MSAALEVLRAAQEGDRDACEQAVLENNGLIWSVALILCPASGVPAACASPR